LSLSNHLFSWPWSWFSYSKSSIILDGTYSQFIEIIYLIWINNIIVTISSLAWRVYLELQFCVTIFRRIVLDIRPFLFIILVNLTFVSHIISNFFGVVVIIDRVVIRHKFMVRWQCQRVQYCLHFYRLVLVLRLLLFNDVTMLTLYMIMVLMLFMWVYVVQNWVLRLVIQRYLT
jgi:hypothetical protein